MKAVKILSMTFVMSVLCVGMMFAQQQGQKPSPKVKATPEERATKQVEMMKKTLNLTPDQVTKMQAIQTQFNKDQEASKGTKQDMKAKMDAYDAQVKGVLTPDQYKKYVDQKAEKAKTEPAKVEKSATQPSAGAATHPHKAEKKTDKPQTK